MIYRQPRAAAAVLILLLARAGAQLEAETFAVTRPSPALCQAQPGAVYTVENGALKPVQGVFSTFPPEQEPLTLWVNMGSSAEPGQLARFYFWSVVPLDGVAVQLGTPGKNPVSRTQGFRSSTSGSTELWTCLLGMPAGSAAKNYTLTVRAAAGSRSWLLLQPFAVADRRFFAERIRLDSELTALATRPDPRKAIEARIFSATLSTVHPDALFQSGPFIDPLPGAHRTAGYGDRREYVYADGSTGASIHAGLDIGAPAGTPVAACGRGRVVLAQKLILTGNTVVIEHLPGLYSICMHMSQIVVKPGDVVGQGDVIGMVGMTGLATGPHLHWEVQASGVAVDPEALTREPLLDKSADFIDIRPRISTEGR
jgi:murein DD-endopeptidase MepM/ murein hydrolase activator NlpD